MAAAEDPELDTEQLLEQGDELLRASRRLLNHLDDVIDIRDDGAETAADHTGSSVDSK